MTSCWRTISPSARSTSTLDTTTWSPGNSQSNVNAALSSPTTALRTLTLAPAETACSHIIRSGALPRWTSGRPGGLSGVTIVSSTSSA